MKFSYIALEFLIFGKGLPSRQSHEKSNQQAKNAINFSIYSEKHADWMGN